MSTVVKGDFIEISYTGYANGEVFDSNRENDLKKLSPDAKVEKTFLIVGEGMVVKGLDHAFEGKETGKEYTLDLTAKEAFGPRHASLIRPLPLKMFTEKQVQPRVGMSFVLDSNLVQVRAVSGARVIVDFNNPLAGKDLHYVFTITEKIEDMHQKTKIFFERFMRGSPEFEVGEKVTIKGPAAIKQIVEIFAPKFKSLVGKELDFKIVEPTAQKKSAEHHATQQSL